MMKKLLLLSFCLLLIATVGANAQFSFVKLFPSNTFQTGNGSAINNGIAMDPLGRLWISSYTTVKDSILSNGVYIAVGNIWIFNPDGSQASFSPMKVLSGVDQSGKPVNDTLNGNLLARGTTANGYSGTTSFRRGPDGNMYLMRGSTNLWKLNYKTGAVMQRIINPMPDLALSQSGGNGSAFCTISNDGEVYVGPVFPGSKPVALSPDFKNVDNVLPATAGFARTMLVSRDGADLYIPRFDLLNTLHYQGDALSGYVFKDTLFKGLVCNSMDWDPKTGYLWATSGGKDGAVSNGPWIGSKAYAFDMTNRSKPVLKDSIQWKLSATFPPGTIDSTKLEIRGMAFSLTGDTLMLALFTHDTAGIQMFKRGTTFVEPQPGILPTSYTLQQNYPNPFNPSTVIAFEIANPAFTTLRVYDMLGREVATLVDQRLPVGAYKVQFNAANLSSGTYIYVLTSGEQRLSKKMLLLK